MEDKKYIQGHLFAMATIFLWGTTFISTKILLREFQPIEILFFRFLLGFLVLIVIYPKRLKTRGWKEEKYFIAAGLCGITLYYLFENIALTYTMASNVGVIISVSPFFTALLARIVTGEKALGKRFFLGFFLAMCGICLITFGGNTALHLSPKGDLLAVLAAFVWAVYSMLTKKIGSFGHNIIQATRRCFAWGLLFMSPVLLFTDFSLETKRFLEPLNMGNLLFLGIGASAICFVTWNTAVKRLGAVKTTVYIYMVPVVTIITSVLILGEVLTVKALAGAFLTIAGLFLSVEKKKKRADCDLLTEVFPKSDIMGSESK